MSIIENKTLVELHEGLRNKEFTSVELTKETFERIHALEPKVEAFVTLNEEEALQQAAAADAKGYGEEASLQGLPIGIKDNIVTRDLLTTASSRMLEDFNPIYDAHVMELLKAEGAVNVGKLNMDEFAMGGSTETSYFKKTKNPWDLTKVPGGSSGGSIRQPASFTGIVGMKPTYGRISRYGLIAFASSLDQIGPFTRTVKDNALVLSAISGYDHRDSTSVPQEVPAYHKGLTGDIKGMRIALPKEYFAEGVDPEVQAAVLKAADQYREMGAIVEEVSLPHSKYGIPAYYIIASSEASSNLQRFDGIRYGHRSTDAETLEDLYVKSRSEGFGMEVKRRIMLGTFSLSSGYYDAYFKKAGQVRTLIKQDFAKVFENYDLILGPVTTSAAFGLGAHSDDPIAMYMADLLTVPVNLAGLPAISVPAGFTNEGLPVGIQLIGNYFQEKTIYQAAYAFEQANDYYLRRPQL